MSQLTIQGSTPGPYYVTDTSALYPKVIAVFETLRGAQRSALSTTGAMAFDQGALYATVAPAPGTP